MHMHGPACLAGPASKDRPWWSADVPSSPADGIRADLVERVRREIAAGTYETEDKLEIALARLFHDLDQA